MNHVAVDGVTDLRHDPIADLEQRAHCWSALLAVVLAPRHKVVVAWRLIRCVCAKSQEIAQMPGACGSGTRRIRQVLRERNTLEPLRPQPGRRAAPRGSSAAATSSCNPASSGCWKCSCATRDAC